MSDWIKGLENRGAWAVTPPDGSFTSDFIAEKLDISTGTARALCFNWFKSGALGRVSVKQPGGRHRIFHYFDMPAKKPTTKKK